MMHGIIRAATAVLLLAIAVLVYFNYFRHTDSTLSERSELATPPEIPKLAANPESALPAELADPGAAPTQNTAPASTAAQPQSPRAEPNRSTRSIRLPKVEVIESDELADIIDIPGAKSTPAAGIPASVQTPPAKPAGKRTHVVQPGESLWVIARKYLGSGELNAKIAECNGLTSKDHIRAGQILVIPDLNGTSAPLASTPKGVIRASAEAPIFSEDLADDDEGRHATGTTQKSNGALPAAMNAVVKRP